MSIKSKKSAADFGTFPRAGSQEAYQPPFMDVREFLASLWRGKVFIASALLVAMLAAGLYLLTTPKSYTATAQLLVDLNRPLTGEAESLGADTTRFMMGPVIDSQVEIIRANRIIRNVIEKTGYGMKIDATTGEPMEQATTAPGTATAKPPEEPAAGKPQSVPLAVISRFQANLDVRRKGLTLILLVQFTDRDPERAALVANTLVAEYLADRERTEQAASQRAIETLKARIAQARRDITEGEKQLQELSEENNLFSAGGTTLDERQIAETVTQLNIVRSEEAKLLSDLKQWENQSKSNSGIATIGKLAEARHNYEVVRNQVLILENTLSDLKEQFVEKTTAISRFVELQKEIQIARDNYLAMVNRMKQLETERNYSMLDIQMLDSAGVPQEPSNPNVPLVLAAGLIGGLGLGIAVALIKDHVSTVLRSPQLVQNNLGVPHIASLNRLRGRKTDPFTVLNTQQNSAFVHSILMIHRFLAETKSGSQRIIAIISADEGDGKTTVAATLAQYSASITHQRTALVDCDIHQRSLSKRFAPDAPYSFVHGASGTIPAANVMTEPEGCAFSLCAAPWEENELNNIEIAMSPGMSKFVKTLAREFDLVILDTPGILSNVETRALVSVADLVIMVVDARRTSVEDVATARDMAPELEAKLAGVVLNHVG